MTVIITVAGISSRFNEGVLKQERKLKAIYTEGASKDTLLYNLLKKCSSFTDKIIIVGGYKFESLRVYCEELKQVFRNEISLIYNAHFEELNSGYSLYLGLQEAFKLASNEILFVEGDLDFDKESFKQVIYASGSVLTYTTEPIYANKAVVLYQNKDGCFKYAFNSSHGLLSINEPFASILNSGQIWKFTDIEALKRATSEFEKNDIDGTNLRIIQRYIDALNKESKESIELVKLTRWTNCNTKDDYRKIVEYWRSEK